MTSRRAAGHLGWRHGAILLAASTATCCALSSAAASTQLVTPLKGHVRPFPCRLIVHPPLLDIVTDGWQRSDTLRRQCRELAEAGTVIALDWLIGSDVQTHARAYVGITSDGKLTARIAVPTGGRVLEFVAHELEHVLERTQGVDWALESERAGSGVWRTLNGFETQRAIDTGRQVAAELKEAARPKPR